MSYQTNIKSNKFPIGKSENESVVRYAVEGIYQGTAGLSKRIGASLTSHITVLGWDNVLFPEQAIYGGSGLNNILIKDWDSEDLKALAKLEDEVVTLLKKSLKWSRKVVIVSYRPRDYVVRTCRVYMRAVYDLIVKNSIEIISTENAVDGASPVSWKRDIYKSIIEEHRLPMVLCMFMSVGFGENDRAAVWALEGAVIPQHRMRVKLLPECASIGE